MWHLNLTQQDNVTLLWIWKPLFHSHETIDFYAGAGYMENATK
jgi:hypothetical protein